MSNLLIEIGTEELPESVQDTVESTLQVNAEKIFRENRLDFTGVKIAVTPRRIALYVEGLVSKQKDQVLEFSGPSFDKAYQSDGKPTPALEGFLKSKSAKLEEVMVQNTPRGKYIFLKKEEKGKTTTVVLPEILNQIFSSLSFSRPMRWESTGLRFPRPVRWLMGLLDQKILKFSWAGLTASNVSCGHRFLSPASFVVRRADWDLYEKELLKRNVIVNREERKKQIRLELEKKFRQIEPDEDLVHTTASLVEEPFLIEGGFLKEYLNLPAEVLVSTMKKNQKIFALKDGSGKLNGKFAAVLNGARKNLTKIRADFENVLESRLRDAKYFYQLDADKPLEEWVKRLAEVAYLGKLGNLSDKTHRLERLVSFFCSQTENFALEKELVRTAHLSKVDLLSHLVYEFPDLQGIAGRDYALKAGESKETARAIETQYLPKNLSQNSQELKKDFTKSGALFGVVDRFDLLVGAFATGLQPTGSQDPYALRRAGGVIVKLSRTFEFDFSLKEAIQFSLKLYSPLLGEDACAKELGKVIQTLKNFFKDRIIFELQPKPGSKAFEILNAVMPDDFDSIGKVFERYEKLNHFYQKNESAFMKAAKVAERTSNIIKGARGQVGTEIKESALTETSEKKLYDLLSQNEKSFSELIDNENYEKAVQKYGELFEGPLEVFFKEVMVNAEDPVVRQNRQALMKRIHLILAGKVADLSVLSRTT